MYVIVKHPKKEAEHAIVRKENLEKGVHSRGCVLIVYVGNSPEDSSPDEVIKAKPKTATWGGPGRYWRKIHTIHGE
jgi:hypothetical protein